MLIKVNTKFACYRNHLFLYCIDNEMKKNLHISLILMLLVIMALIAFQGFWLRKNYAEEKQALTVNTNILFREAARDCEIAKFKLDTNQHSYQPLRSGAAGLINVVNRGFRDSLTDTSDIKGSIMISVNSKDVNHNSEPFHQKDSSIFIYQKDSLPFLPGNAHNKEIKMSWRGKNEFLKVLSNLDSLQDSVTVKDLTGKYRTALQKQKIDIAFYITRLPDSISGKSFIIKTPQPNEVALGFMRPICFRLTLSDTGNYLFKKLWPQILVSLLLIGFTVLSFWILYRNLLRQQRLNQLKNDFIGNITHELKTPIATVSVALEAMRNFDVLKDPEKTKGYLDISSSELQRLNLLVDKVLKLSMFENKEITLQKTSFNIKELVEEVVATMKLQLERQQATLNISSTGDNFMMEADRLHMSSVVYNLVDNALKYGGPKPEIEIDLVSHTAFMELKVTDKGIGIAPEYRKQVFEKFFRVPTGNVHNTKGYGLGLSYVNYILQRHQGFIEVESELGKGSSFSAKFPYKESKEVTFNKNGKILK